MPLLFSVSLYALYSSTPTKNGIAAGAAQSIV